MKTPSLRPLRTLALTTLLMLPFVARAATSPAADPAAQLLSQRGRVALTSAGSYVNPGTFRIQVAAKLGEPDTRLADGTWLYHHRRIEGSTAGGTLVIRFERGRVQSLALVTPAVATAMREKSRPGGVKDLVAAK